MERGVLKRKMCVEYHPSDKNVPLLHYELQCMFKTRQCFSGNKCTSCRNGLWTTGISLIFFSFRFFIFLVTIGKFSKWQLLLFLEMTPVQCLF